MSLNCLVLCSDNRIMRTLRRVLSDLEVSVEHCLEVDSAVRRLTRRRFEAVIVDCEDDKIAAQIFRSVRSAPRNKRAVAVAVIDSQRDVNSAFRMGAHFALHKPLTLERARASFRAVRALMKCERRRNVRVPIEIPVNFIDGKGNQHKITTSDLAEGGMAVKIPRRAKPSGVVTVRFTLPGTDHTVGCSAEVAWDGSGSQTGIRFLDLSLDHRDQLRWWLNRHAPDIEEQDPPIRCQLTDLSQGGCYLKTTTPFPAGTRLVLVMRVGESRAHVDAIVRVMHPSIGMGLEFMHTGGEREQVTLFLRALANAKGTMPEIEVEPEGIDDQESVAAHDSESDDPLLSLFQRYADLSPDKFQEQLRMLRLPRTPAKAANA